MKLTREEWIAAAVVGSGLVFGLLGAYSSFEAVDARMEPSFGDESWMVPVGADLGIAVFTAGDLWMAWRGWRTWWLRYLPLGLSAATLYLNVVGEPTLEGRVGHGLLVFLWIAFAHAVAHVVHLHAVGRRERRARWWRRERLERLDRIRLSRWVLAPGPTFRLWRDMVLWEVRSYTQALRLVGERELALCDIEDSYGSFKAAPPRVRTLFKLARFDELAAVIAAEKTPTPVARPAQVTSNGSGDHAADLIAKDMKARGEKLNRRTLLERARAAGVPLGTGKAAEIAGRHR